MTKTNAITSQHAENLTAYESTAAYIRVSHDEQKKRGLSLEAQEKSLNEYAQSHNLKIVAWYRDEGVSGRKLIKNRPELQRMIHDAQKGMFKRIIFIKLDRFFRSVAEYHECMKLIRPVIWTATEEDKLYDLSTASGEMIVNVKLTMAQFEADQTGERIKFTNGFKIANGQPLFGTQCFPFCYGVARREGDSRHKCVVKQNEEHMNDLIAHVMVNHSVRGGMVYINNKYGTQYGYNTIRGALNNPMIYGMYGDNPKYCEPYMTKEEFDYMHKTMKRSPRTSDTEHSYIFTGLMKCPVCGRNLSGNTRVCNRPNNKKYKYYCYRCPKSSIHKSCSFKTSISENVLERDLLDNIENLVSAKKANIVKMQADVDRVGKYNVAELEAELSRLNYMYQKDRISDDDYDKQYEKVSAQLNAARAEYDEINDEPDYESIQSAFVDGWRDIYNALDFDKKRAFWRSLRIKDIQFDLENGKKISDIIFF